MNSNLWKSPYLSCLPLALIPSDWEVQLLCISPGRWLHATALIRAGTIDPVFPRYWRDCRVADSGYYAWAAEPCSQPSAGFSVPKCWAFCASRTQVRCTQSMRQMGKEWGEGCWKLAAAARTPSSSWGTHLTRPRSKADSGRRHQWDTTCPLHAALHFQLHYHINEITEGIKTLHFHFIL